LTWVAIGVVLVVALGTGGTLAWRALSRAQAPVTTAADAQRPDPFPSPTAARYSTIPGTKITDLTAWWSDHWNESLEYDGDTVFSATVTPRSGGRLTISAQRPEDDVLGWPREVSCKLERPGLTVDRAVLGVLVDECLRPVLKDQEQQDVPTWVNGAVVNLRAGEERREEFPRFDAAVARFGTGLSISLRAR
jgi:hypothetical protein